MDTPRQTGFGTENGNVPSRRRSVMGWDSIVLGSGVLDRYRPDIDPLPALACRVPVIFSKLVQGPLLSVNPSRRSIHGETLSLVPAAYPP